MAKRTLVYATRPDGFGLSVLELTTGGSPTIVQNIDDGTLDGHVKQRGGTVIT